MSETGGHVKPPEAVETQFDSRAQGEAGGIVVGLDGSKGSLRALRWALDEARLRGIAVPCVLAWEQEIPYYGGGASRVLEPDQSIGGKPDLLAHAAAELARLKDESGVQDDMVITSRHSSPPCPRGKRE